MNTCDMIMTKSQENALEYAIIKIVDSEVTRMNRVGSGNGKYRVTMIDIKTLTEAVGETPIKGKDIIELRMKFDNGRPGTIGYNNPGIVQLFIGKNGAYSSYKKHGNKKFTGKKALLNCVQHFYN